MTTTSGPPVADARIPADVYVEVVRVLVVGVCTAAGFEMAGGSGAAGSRALVGACLGACLGYVQGGVVGRFLRAAVARLSSRVERTPPASLVGAVIGGVLLGGLGALVGLGAVALLPNPWGWPVVGLVTWSGVYAGVQAGAAKGPDVVSSFRRPDDRDDRFAPSGPAGNEELPLLLVDSSAAIDGRLLDVAATGFLPGRLAVPRFVLDELQGIGDAADHARRRRGRRGLETLDELRRDPELGVRFLDDEMPGFDAVDAKLLALARRLHASVLTVDAGLCQAGELQGVPCRNLNRLARSLQPVLVPGEVVRLRVAKEGRDTGQGIGFLEDGTMVVVSDGGGLIGTETDVSITSSVQTARGRMFFASLAA